MNSGDFGSGLWAFWGCWFWGEFWRFWVRTSGFCGGDFELNSGDLGLGLQGLWGGFWGFGAVDFEVNSGDFGVILG